MTSEQAAEAQVIDPTLVSNFTHQIINPLNGVVGTVDNLIDGTIKGDRREQRLRAVRAQLSHTIELVRNLAFFSQLATEAGREGLRRMGGNASVPECVIDAAMFFQEITAKKGMSVDLLDRRTQYSVDLPRDLLRQVFTNLIENAVKYGDAETAVTIEPRVQRRTDTLIVDVKNHGPGFDNDEKERIFGKGERGRAAEEIVASGSGLGLYICRGILDAFGASIEGSHAPRTRETTMTLRFSSYRISRGRTLGDR